jgi:hypothetical protein
MNSFFWCFVLVLTGSHIAQSGFELATLGGLKQAVSMTDFKVAVQETRPRSLSPRTGQIQTLSPIEKTLHYFGQVVSSKS